MEPTGKQKPETQGPAPAPPFLESALSKDVDHTPMLPWTAAESSEHGRTLNWPGTTAKVVYPFFLHNIFAGLVSPFSSFFTAILNHYGIQPLQLQPNSILLMSVFAFYREAFVGVRPSVTLFRHFFSLRLHDGAHLSACVSFVVAQSGNFLVKARKELPTEEPNRVVVTLMGGDPGELPEALGPLYRLHDRADLIVVLPVFDERGLLPAEGSGPVEVSSDDTFGGEDLEKSADDCPASAPLPSLSVLLHELENDDLTSEVFPVISSRVNMISKGPASAPRTMPSACVLAPVKHGAESPLMHPASAGRKSEAPDSPPPWGALPPLPSSGREEEERGRRQRVTDSSW
ncbi:hypothetical protein D1007_11650 [Hordeum vulgare]|nr:hypothetical protein D1007_11650 [Hordeum vulgare]